LGTDEKSEAQILYLKDNALELLSSTLRVRPFTYSILYFSAD
jgi:hypothetical protein